MKIALSVNDKPNVVAELDAHGYLGAHLNLRRADSGVEDGSISISGYDLTNGDSTKSLKWPQLVINSGDKVTLEIDSGIEATPPNSINESAANPVYDNLQLEQAQQILKSVDEQINDLNKILESMRSILSESDFKIFALSVGHVMASYYEKIESPIYRCHPSLLPDGLKDFSL